MSKGAYSDLLKDYDDAAKKQREEIERDLQADIGSVLDTPAGRRFIWWLLCISGVFLPSYTGNSDTYFNEGRRGIGLELVHRITQARPGAFESMICTGETQ